MHWCLRVSKKKVGCKSDYTKPLLGDIHSYEKTLLSRNFYGSMTVKAKLTGVRGQMHNGAKK